MEATIKDKVHEIQPELISKIRQLVAIESVQGESETDAPFGDKPKKALELALKIADELGFQTVNLDNRIGYAQYGADNEAGYFGIFGHVDVVELGQGWVHDPLGGEIENNRLYGRGVLDNKGPILSNLYALYILKELGIKLPIPVRVVFGCNEESGFECVKYYNTIEPAPVFGWTPDCKWPVVYGERGRLVLQIINQADSNHDFFNYINEFFLSSLPNGNKLGINFKDDDFGELIMRGFRFFEKNERTCFQFSISYPKACSKKSLVEIIQTKLYQNLKLEVVSNWDPILYDKESQYVKILQQVYCEITNRHSYPVTTTGGTYAKIIPNIIAYGPSYPEQRDIAHLPDEWIDLSDLEQNTYIYALALYRLSQL